LVVAGRGFIDRIEIPPGDGLLQVVGNLGEMLTAASGGNDSTLAAVGKVGCGGTQPSIPTDFLVPTELYVVAA